MVPGLKKRETSVVRLKLSAFAVFVLRRRALRNGQTLAETVESLLWDNVGIAEAQTVVSESPEAARAFRAWFAARPRSK
jgi:hypothetical protein